MSRLSRFSCAVPAAAALVLGAVAAPAALAAPPTDPEFRALAAASAYTRGLTLAGANFHQETSLTSYPADPGTRIVTDLGYTDTDAAMRVTWSAPAPAGASVRARAAGVSVPWGMAKAPADRPSRPRAAVASPSYTTWFGYAPEIGNYDYLDRAMLGPDEKRALKALGAPGATFVVAPSGYGNFDSVKVAAPDVNPADFLPSVIDSQARGNAQIGDVTAEPGADGATVYTVPVADTTMTPATTYPYRVTVTADGVVSRVDLSLTDANGALAFQSVLDSWGPDVVVSAAMPLGAVTVDADAYYAQVAYFNGVQSLRNSAEMIATEADRVAKVAGVDVNARIIRNVAADLAGYYSFLAANIARGIRMTYPGVDTYSCDVVARPRAGLITAATKCRPVVQAAPAVTGN